MNPFDAKEWLEARDLLVWWSPDKNRLCGEIGIELQLPPAVLAAIQGPQRGTFARLLVYYGLRAGYHRIRSRWHVVVFRLGRYESACSIVLHDQERDSPLARELPPPGPDDRLCRRCCQALVRYELDRDSSLARRHSNA